MVGHMASGRNVSVLGPSFAIVFPLGLPRSVLSTAWIGHHQKAWWWEQIMVYITL